MSPRLADIAQGRLRVLRDGETRADDFVSPFAEQVRERAASSERRAAWKEGGSSFASTMGRGAAAQRGGGDVRFVESTTWIESGERPGPVRERPAD